MVRILVILLLWSGPVVAQYTALDTRDYASLELGTTYSWHSNAPGFFFPYVYQFDTREPSSAQRLRFQQLGEGLGFRVGGAIDVGLMDDAAVRVSLHYGYQTTSQREQANYDCSGNLGTAGMVRLESYYYSRWEYLGLDVLLRKSLYGEQVYGLIGGGYAYLLGDKLNGSQRIVSSNDNCEYLWLPTRLKSGNMSVGVEDQTSQNYYAQSQYFTKIGVGAFLPFNDNIVISPEVMLNVPLERMLTSAAQAEYGRIPAATPKMWSVDFMVSLRYAIGEPTRRYEPVVPELNRQMMSTMRPQRVESPKSYALTGKVRSTADNLPLQAEVLITRLDTVAPVITGRTSVIGYYNIAVPSPGTYSVTATAEDHLFGSTLFVVNPDGSLVRGNHDVSLSPEAHGRIRLLIFFDVDKAELREISYPELDRAAELLRTTPSMNAEIAGHTDSTGTMEHNVDLSKRRAESVRTYLISKGIGADRLTAEGYGATKPVSPNSYETGRAENRRVEFVVKKR